MLPMLDSIDERKSNAERDLRHGASTPDPLDLCFHEQSIPEGDGMHDANESSCQTSEVATNWPADMVSIISHKHK